MADQRSSSSSFSYDVFISFLGQDSSNGFAGHLWKVFNDRGIHAFLADDELSKWNETTLELVKAIQESRIAIIVFSENYVFSSFCLDVLAYIVDNFQENNNPKPYRLILPVYVDISPSDVQNQTGPSCEDNNKLIKWRNALSHVANLPAWNFKHGGGFDEFKIIKNIVEQVARNFDPVPLHNAISDVVHRDSQTSQSVHSLCLYVTPEMVTWSVVGHFSSVVGLVCYTLSPTFDRLIGRWKPYKFFLQSGLSVAILTTILFANLLPRYTGIGQLKKACAIFTVVMIISVYSFFYERAVDGKPDILSAVSNALFALVSLSLHKLSKFKSDIGVFSYFLGVFTVQLLTINWMLIFVAIIYGCLLSVIHSQGDSQTIDKVVQVMMSKWRVVGFMSGAAGLLCYPFSRCFDSIIKLWEPFKVVYLVLTVDILITISLKKAQSSPSTWYAELNTYTSFAVLLMISMYGFFSDKHVDGKHDIPIVVSNGLFALMSISLHNKLYKFQYEIGMITLYTYCFTMKLLFIMAAGVDLGVGESILDCYLSSWLQG